jgi:hypothetical protein
MIDLDWNPEPRKLRQFAVASLVGFPMLGYLATRLLPATVLPSAAGVLLVAALTGAVVCVTGLLHAPAVRPVYAVMLALALPIGLVLGFVLVPVIYFGVFTPVAMILRMAGADPMQRRFLPAGTYWTKRKPSPPAASYFRQY